MDELRLVGRLRADRALPGPARLEPLRAQLVASIADTRPMRARRQRPRLVLRGAIAVAVGGAVAVGAIGFRPAARTVAPPPVGSHLSLAREVLRAAALSAASQPASEPRRDQWVYAKTVTYNIGSAPLTNEGWVTFDASQDAYEQDGTLVVHTDPGAGAAGSGSPLAAFDRNATPLTAYEAIASLPTDHQALLDAVDHDTATIAGSGWDPARGHPTRAQWEFGYLAKLLWNDAQVAPARQEAAVFHAIASIPGVSAQSGVTDAAGRPAVALSIGGVSQQLLLDPRTYRVTGQRTVSDGTWPKDPKQRDSATWPQGTVIGGLAWETIAFVDRPGER